jgi:muramoyltetrapeptide carboxypeptidase
VKLVKPRRLVEGDTIGVVAPSHPVMMFHEKYDEGIKNLRELGFKVKEGKTVRLSYRDYMAGTDEERAKDINAAFADREVKAIVCAFGGQVAIRTLRYLDFDLIRMNPKVFSGMSDIATYHLAFLARAGLSGLHQTDVTFGFGADINSEEAKYERNMFYKVTMNAEPMGALPALTKWEVWREGSAKGRLFGGNMNSIQCSIGTRYIPKLNEDTIFFWEAMTQPLSHIDQKLAHFREAGLFDRARGMLIGKIRGEEGGALRDMTDEVKPAVLEIAQEFDFPVIAGMDFGHYTPNIPFPMWLRASMNTEQVMVSIDETFVT